MFRGLSDFSQRFEASNKYHTSGDDAKKDNSKKNESSKESNKKHPNYLKPIRIVEVEDIPSIGDTVSAWQFAFFKMQSNTEDKTGDVQLLHDYERVLVDVYWVREFENFGYICHQALNEQGAVQGLVLFRFRGSTLCVEFLLTAAHNLRVTQNDENHKKSSFFIS